MKLLVRHTFACTPEEFWTMFWDPAYEEYLQTGTAVRRDLLSDTEEDGIRVQKFRFVPEKPLPGPIARLTGTERLTYEQESRYDPVAKTVTWKVIPALLPDKVSADGMFYLEPAPEGCTRVVDGRIEVRVPLVGGRIEQAILDAVTQGYEGAAKATREFLARPRA